VTVNASDLVPRDEQASRGDVWEPLAIFNPDASAPMRLGTRWQTVVNSSLSAGEKRYVRDVIPDRSSQFVLHTKDREDTNALRNTLIRMGKARSLWPIYPDVASRVQYAPASNFRFLGDFSNRRIEEGQYVCFAPPQRMWHAHRRPNPVKVVSVTDNELIVDDDPGISPALPPSLNQTPVLSTTVASVIGIGAGFEGPAETGDKAIVFVCWKDTPGSAASITSSSLNGQSVSPFLTNWWSSRGLGVAAFIVDVVAPGGFDVTFGERVSFVAIRGYKITDFGDELRILDSDIQVGDDNSADMTVIASEGNAIGIAFVAANTSTAHDLPGGTEIADTTDSFSARFSGWTFDPNDPFDQTDVTVSLSSPQSHAALTIVIGGDDSSNVDGGYCYPMIECDLDTSVETSLVTDDATRTGMQVFEVAGPGAAPTVGTPGQMPSAFSSAYDGTYPILDIEPNWISAINLSYERDGNSSDLGLGRTQDVYGAKSRAKLTYRFLFDTRQSAWDFLEFFDTRGGRGYPFWGTVPTIDLELEGVSFNAGPSNFTLTFKAQASIYDWNWFTHLALVEKITGTVHLIRVTDAADAAGVQHIITTESGVPLPSNDPNFYRRVCPAMLMRFDQDSITEEWYTPSVMSCVVETKELVEEKDVEFSVPPICKGDVPGATGWTFDQDFDLCQTRCAPSDCNWCIDNLEASIKVYRYRQDEVGGLCVSVFEGVHTFDADSPSCEPGNALRFAVSFTCPTTGLTENGELTVSPNGEVWSLPLNVFSAAELCVFLGEDPEVELCGTPPGGCTGSAPDVSNCTTYREYTCVYIDDGSGGYSWQWRPRFEIDLVNRA
jgi:hypothetical protein